MPKMTAIEAAVHVLESEGVTVAFGVPGAAINPFYAALQAHGRSATSWRATSRAPRTWPRATRRAKAGNIGVCIGTSGPAGTDMITGLYSALADTIPILCITGQAPRAKLHKEDFQAIDIESIAKPVTKWAVTVREPALVPRVFQQAFHVMRSGRPGPVLIDLPIDVQMAEIEFDIETYEPLPVYKPAASRRQIEKALAMLNEAERPLIVAGGGIINADASDLLVEFAEITGVPVIPTLMGWGAIPDDHPLMAGMVGLQTSHRYGNAHVPEVRLRARHRQPLGQPPHRLGRELHQGPQVRPCRHRADPDRPRVQPRLRHRLGREGRARAVRRGRAGMEGRRAAQGPRRLGGRVRASQAHMLRRTHFDKVPMKPQRVYQEMNEAFDRDTCYVTTIGLSQIAGAQFLHVYKPRNWINCGQAGPLGWTLPAALGVRAADPDREIVALSGDYDFQFMIEELAVGAQHKLPYLHVVVNNSYLGLIRQSQRGFKMDFEVSLAFENINSAGGRRLRRGSRRGGRGPGLQGDAGARARTSSRTRSPGARELMEEHQVPVVLEFILERVTNIAMGTEIHNVNEFEEILCLDPSLTLDDVSGSVLRSAADATVLARQKEPAPA